MKQIFRFIGDFSQCFVFALTYILCAVPLAHFFGVSVWFAGKDMFGEVSPLTDHVLLLTSMGVSIFTVAFFLLFGRYWSVAIFGGLSPESGILRHVIVITAVFVALAVPSFAVLAYFIFSHKAQYASALLNFTMPVPPWIIPIAITLAGFASGFGKKVPGVESPPELDDLFNRAAAALRAIPEKIEQSLSTGTDLLQGGYLKVAMSLMGLSALATAFTAENTSHSAVIFGVPLICALKDLWVLRCCRLMFRSVSAKFTGFRYFGLTSIIGAILVLCSVGLLLVGLMTLNSITGIETIDAEYESLVFWNAPFKEGLFVLLVLAAPFVWVIVAAVEEWKIDRPAAPI